jgi:CheY-like chemotaxis protein
MGLTILLVEDNPLNQELARDLLEDGGHQVEVVEDADGFRAQLENDIAPDVILMDVLLPGTDGVALLRELRASPRLPDVPVIAVTAQALSGDMERFTAAGFDAVITKPIDTRTFVGAVEQHARSGRNRRMDGEDPHRR